jgi:hypothetical protein
LPTKSGHSPNTACFVVENTTSVFPRQQDGDHTPSNQREKKRTEHSKQISGTAICRDHKKQWPDSHNTDLFHKTNKFSSMENLDISQYRRTFPEENLCAANSVICRLPTQGMRDVKSKLRHTKKGKTHTLPNPSPQVLIFPQ